MPATGTLFDLTGKTAIITGSTKGIGKAIAEQFAEHGARVVISSRKPGPCEEVAAAINAKHKPGTAIAVPANISSKDDLKRLGGIDVLFNNAGVSGRWKIEDQTDDAWNRVLAVNVTAPMRITRAALPELKKSKAGRIINTASVMAEVTDIGLSAYCASKAGVAGLTRTLALELGKYGITANYILPGAIKTGMTMPLWNERPDIAEIWAKKSPLRRLGEPEDLARAALFLASEDSGFVTGHGLAADGGLRLRC